MYGNEWGHLILLRVTSSDAREALDVFFLFRLEVCAIRVSLVGHAPHTRNLRPGTDKLGNSVNNRTRSPMSLRVTVCEGIADGRGQLGMFMMITVTDGASSLDDYGRLEMLSFKFPFFVTQFRTQSASFTSERVMHGEFRINVRCVFNAISSYVYYHAPEMKPDYTYKCH